MLGREQVRGDSRVKDLQPKKIPGRFQRRTLALKTESPFREERDSQTLKDVEGQVCSTLQHRA